MKKIFTLGILSLVCVTGIAEDKTKTDISNVNIKKCGEKVSVTFDASVRKLSKDYSLTLFPVLCQDEHNVDLPPVEFIGRKRSILNARHRIPTQAKRASKYSYYYEIEIPFEIWMKNLTLQIQQIKAGCCNHEALSLLTPVENKQIYFELNPVFNTEITESPLSDLEKYDRNAPFLYPATDYDKRHEIFERERENGALVVFFEQAKSNIDKQFRSNANTLAEVDKVFDLIENDPNAVLKKIVIVGLTSPEGPLTLNDKLAESRALALKKYLGNRFSNQSDLFELINGSEDWNGLRKLVDESSMPNRSEVLNIIDSYSIKGGREAQLMKLKSGEPYRYMLKYFFPLLRNAGYVQIFYDRKVDEKAILLKDALELIKAKQFSDALPFLHRLTPDGMVNNLIGVCYMMNNEFVKARSYLMKAILQGDSHAEINLRNMQEAEKINFQK